MLRRLFSVVAISAISFASTLFSVNYEVRDIDTLQTHSSQAIAINNEGQILGWYNLDGTSNEKRYFVRNSDGNIQEIGTVNGLDIDWKFLTNNGKAYGKFNGTGPFGALFMWDRYDGIVNLGNLPGPDISAINDSGQVLIQFVTEQNQAGINSRYPVIWHNGKTTKLHGLVGNLGMESTESYAFDMNNKGDVVGTCVVELVYKNKVYTQCRPTKWINGQPIDLYNIVPKGSANSAKYINDNGDIIISPYLVKNSGEKIEMTNYASIILSSKSSNNYLLGGSYIILDGEGKLHTSTWHVNESLKYDYSSIWQNVIACLAVNDHGEIIALGKTIYGEDHAVLLVPEKE